MEIKQTKRITIVGAGMAGTHLAILLARRGFGVDLFEQHPDPHSGDRCYLLTSNLALGERREDMKRVGHDISPEIAKRAQKMGALDDVKHNLPAAVRDANIVLLSLPVNEIRATLEEAIEAGGSSLRDYRQADGELGYFQHSFKVYDQEGAPCRTDSCKGLITRIVQSGRSSFYCPKCQR